MALNLFSEASTDSDSQTREEYHNYRVIFLMNRDAKIPANQIQQPAENHDWVGFILGMQG